MNFIINILSSILGYLMNVFYVLLDFIGTPYIWACIVLFSLVTRFLFLPSIIKNARKKKLKRVVDAEVAEVKCRYLNSEEDEEAAKARKREIKAIYKKYRVSSGSGCLSALIQLPIYIALYNVVVSPNVFVPEIKNLYVDPVANAEIISTIQNFFGLNIEYTPLSLGVAAYIFPLLVCLSSINKSRKTLLGQNFGGPKKEFFYWYNFAMQLLQVVVLTCFSFKLPLGISIYWLTNDVTNFAIHYFVNRSIDNNLEIKNILADYDAKLAQKQEENEATTDEAVSDEAQGAEEERDLDAVEELAENTSDVEGPEQAACDNVQVDLANDTIESNNTDVADIYAEELVNANDSYEKKETD